jgi:hypothetical protein
LCGSLPVSGNLRHNLTVPTYPVFPTLSRKPALRTKTTSIDPTLRDPTENGMETTRAKFTRRRRKWAVTIDFLTLNDQNMLEAFVVNDAVYGANIFSFTDTRQPVGPEIVYDANGTVILPWASVLFVISRSLGISYYAALFSNFIPITMPTAAGPLPADADIQGIYPVFVGSGVLDEVTDMVFASGTGMNIGTLPSGGSAPFTSPSNPNNTTFASTEFYGPSIGATLAALTGQGIMGMLSCSLDIPAVPNATPVMTDAINITAVGFAIYYTSATPTTDTTIAAPFAVPSGQGVAWALPFTVSSTGGPFSDGGGIFAGSSGQALATPTAGTRYTVITTPQALLVRFETIPSYTDAGWMADGFRQNASFEIGEV